jgi:uncharacterized protein involved in exopolysaccharide biosynthesis
MSMKTLFFRTRAQRWAWPVYGLVGALLALLVSFALPPQYQAKSVINVGVDYSVTEPLELVVEDRALNRIAGIVTADDTFQELLGVLPEDIIEPRGWLHPADLRSSLRLDRRLAAWELVVVDPDPEVAAEVANAWSEIVLAAFDRAREHAWAAAGMIDGLPFSVDCARVTSEQFFDDLLGWDCWTTPVPLDESQHAALQAALDSSRGMLPNVSYEWIHQARPPAQPVLWARGPLVLAGGVAGVLMGFLLSLLGTAKPIQAPSPGAGQSS